MKLKYILKKSINLKTGYLVGIVLVLLLIIGGYFSYALFTVSIEAKGALNIVTGNLYSLIESPDLDKDKSITISPNTNKTVTLKLVNTNGVKAKVNLYYEATSDNIEIGYLNDEDKAPTKLGYVLDKNGTDDSSKTIHVKITNNDNIAVKITFGTTAGLDTAELTFPSDKKVIEELKGVKSSNILIAYTYDQTNETTKCITGEEETCVETKCYEIKTAESCPNGTIIKYKVNEDKILYFNVINDSGEKMLLQQRENTIPTVEWSTDNTNTKGPNNLLSKLEEVTKDWTNVNDFDYVINTNSLCTDYDTCLDNKYIITKEKVKARIIKMEEAVKLNCTNNNKSCLSFMNNYLNSAVTYGATVSTDNTSGYWLMEASNNGAWYIDNTGSIKNTSVNNTNFGARAVVEINK